MVVSALPRTEHGEEMSLLALVGLKVAPRTLPPAAPSLSFFSSRNTRAAQDDGARHQAARGTAAKSQDSHQPQHEGGEGKPGGGGARSPSFRWLTLQVSGKTLVKTLFCLGVGTADRTAGAEAVSHDPGCIVGDMAVQCEGIHVFKKPPTLQLG